MRFCPTCGTRFSQAAAFCPHDGAATAELPEEPSPEDALIGHVVDGRYRVEERIGEGGMGVVYRVTHVVLGKSLALKVLRSAMAEDGEVVARFINEAKSASAIGHESIVDIHDFGKLPDGTVYFVMEYLDGRPLADLIKTGGSLPVRDAVDIIRQIASALGAAHDHGVVHRDLKPENIFVVGPDRMIKVLDFGIAKVGNARAKLTRTGVIFGTPHYMSPEQAAGQSVDQRTDVYALGVIAYELFTGQVPFDADTFMGILSKHMFEPVVPPSRIIEGSTSGLGAYEDIVLRALAKKPEARYQSMAALVDDIDGVAAGRSLAHAPSGLADALEAPTRTEMNLAAGTVRLPANRGPIAALILVGLTLSAAGVGGMVYALSADAPEATVPTAPAEPAAPPSAPAETADVPAPPRTVHVRTTPEGAQVTVDSAVIGNTPVRVPRPAAGEALELEISHPGYEPVTVRLDEVSSEEVTVALTELPRAPDAPAPRVTRPVRDPRPGRAELPRMEAAPPRMDAPTMMTPALSSEVVDPWAND